jgi:hypothetical protein
LPGSLQKNVRNSPTIGPHNKPYHRFRIHD